MSCCIFLDKVRQLTMQLEFSNVCAKQQGNVFGYFQEIIFTRKYSNMHSISNRKSSSALIF